MNVLIIEKDRVLSDLLSMVIKATVPDSTIRRLPSVEDACTALFIDRISPDIVFVGDAVGGEQATVSFISAVRYSAWHPIPIVTMASHIGTLGERMMAGCTAQLRREHPEHDCLAIIQAIPPKRNEAHSTEWMQSSAVIIAISVVIIWLSFSWSTPSSAKPQTRVNAAESIIR